MTDAVTSTVPYVGLRPFQTADAARFFGRDHEIPVLMRKVRASRFTAVVGASGSGKSSLVLAGVLPPLLAEGWRAVVTKPGSAPIARLAAKLAQAAAPPEDQFAVARRFGFDTALRACVFGLAEIADELAPADAPLLLVVDQFEELFRYGEEAGGTRRAGMREEARAFVELLLTAARRVRGRLHIVLTLRSDYFGDCARYRGLAEAVSASQYLVPVPDRDQLENAIRRPLAAEGAEIDDGLVQRLLVEVEEETDRLPLLQHTLRRMWEEAKGAPRHLKERDYEIVGGLAGSIDRKAEAILTGLAKEHPDDELTAERVLKALTELDDQDRATRRPQKKSELLPLLAWPGRDLAAAEASFTRVLGALTKESVSFLMTGEGHDPDIDIGHEALIRSWRRLAGDRRDFRSGWLQEERSDGERWREYARRAHEGPLLSPNERRALASWFEQRRLGRPWTARHGDAWEAVDLFKACSRDREVLSVTIVFGSILFLATVAMSLSGAVDEARAEALRSARLGSIALVENACRLGDEGNGRASALLARAALPPETVPSRDNPRYIPRAEECLASALGKPLEVGRLVGHEEVVTSVVFSPDGGRVVTTSWDATARLWNAASGQPLGVPLRGHTSLVHEAVFSPDGELLATSSADGTVRLWNALLGQPVGAPLSGHEGEVLSVAFSPDGERLATASRDGTVRLWNVSDGRPWGPPLAGHQDWVWDVKFSPDGRQLATAARDGTIRLWSARDGQPHYSNSIVFKGSSARMQVEFSRDGRRLAAASETKVWLWRIANGQPSERSSLDVGSQVLDLEFSPDGERLATASEDKKVRLWDMAEKWPIGAPLVGHEGPTLDVAFSPDGMRLATASGDRTARLWDLASGRSLGAPLSDLIERAEALCPLSDAERARFGLVDPMFPDQPKQWTPAQRRACGLDSGSVGAGW